MGHYIMFVCFRQTVSHAPISMGRASVVMAHVVQAGGSCLGWPALPLASPPAAYGENGLLLTPSIDHLFDRGFIGFEDNGRLIISPVAHRPSLLTDGYRDKAARER
jgi:hypothetical protein